MMEFQQRSTTTGSTGGRLAAALIAAAVAVFLAAPAAAQDEAPAPEEEIPEGPLGDQLEDYWSVDRDVDVIKQRLYEREGRFGVGIHTGLMASEPFFTYLPTGIRVDYFLTNAWAIELEGSFMDVDGIFRHRTELTNFAAEQKSNFDPLQDGLDQFEWRAHALAVWHPLYGKLAFLQRKIAHFDLNLVAGFGAVGLTRPTVTRLDTKEIVTPEFVYGGGAQFYINNNIVIRASGRAYIYRGPRRYKNTETGERVVSEPVPTSDGKELNFIQELEFPTEFLLGVTYMF